MKATYEMARLERINGKLLAALEAAANALDIARGLLTTRGSRAAAGNAAYEAREAIKEAKP